MIITIRWHLHLNEIPGHLYPSFKDLVNWEILSYALTDETKFDIKGMDTACGIWAPNLTYDNGTFYLIYTIAYNNAIVLKILTILW